jgi:SHS2 domain-containing protein
MSGARWRTIEHTADLGLEVVAPSLEELFTAAALALAGVLLGSEDGAAAVERDARYWRELALEAPDTEALLVEWLRELLYIQVSEGLLFATARVETLESTRLVAKVGFDRPSTTAPLARELKGITYHDLEVSQRNEGWFARIVLDL